MSDVIIPYEFLCKAGTAAAVAAWNGIPKARQIILETDTGRYKVGDGATHYNDLPYFAGPIGDLSDVDPTAPGDGQVLAWEAASSKWKPTTPSGGGGSGLQLIGSATVAGAAATSMTVSGLDLRSDGAYQIVANLGNANASATNISIFYNGDTTATNYYNQFWAGVATATQAARNNNAAIAGMDASSSLLMIGEVAADIISGYPRGTFRVNRNAPSAISFVNSAHVRNSGANVTSLMVSSSVSNALAVGSSVKVYKIG